MRVDPAVVGFVRARLGPTSEVAWRRLDAGRGRTRVWRVGASPDGQAWVVKRHLGARGFAQEVEALRAWPRRSPELAAAMPKLIAVDERTRCLLLAWVDGRRVVALRGVEAERAHAAAGRFLARLHAAPLAISRPRDPVPIAEALARRVAGSVRACGDHLTAAERKILDRFAPHRVGPLDDRVLCHRDFTPDNWLWADGALTVVDFEHARPDWWLVDWSKSCTTWTEQPGLGAAFRGGYGLDDDDRLEPQLRCALAVHGVATLAWGLRHGDRGFVVEGRRVLGLAGAPRSLV